MPAEIDFLAGDEVAPLAPRAPRASSAPRDESDDDAAFIAAAAQRHNVKAGAEVAKQAQKAKGKAKTASGITSGGGSFQSMGMSCYANTYL